MTFIVKVQENTSLQEQLKTESEDADAIDKAEWFLFVIEDLRHTWANPCPLRSWKWVPVVLPSTLLVMMARFVNHHLFAELHLACPWKFNFSINWFIPPNSFQHLAQLIAGNVRQGCRHWLYSFQVAVQADISLQNAQIYNVVAEAFFMEWISFLASSSPASDMSFWWFCHWGR